MKDLYRDNQLYSLLYPYVKCFYSGSLNKKSYNYLEKVPKDGAIIFAANHTNALMDALVLLFMDNRKKVFVARADIFKNKTIRKILLFLKLMPINRIRDGRENLKKNDQTFDATIQTLKNRVPFCIMPEALHQTKHLVKPITKGISRIALMANKAIDGKFPLYIVPVGISYQDIFNYRSDVLVQIGDAINVTRLLKENEKLSENEKHLLIKNQLQIKLENLVLCIPDNDDYNATDTLCNINPKIGTKDSLLVQLEKKQQLVSYIVKTRENNNEEIIELLKRADNLYIQLKDSKIENISIGARSYKAPINILLNGIREVVLFPLFIITFLASFPTWTVGEYLIHKMKDKVFGNSFRLVLNLIFTTLITLTIFLVLLAFVKWYFAWLIAALLFPSYTLSWQYVKWTRTLISDIRLFLNKPLKKELFVLKEELRNLQ